MNDHDKTRILQIVNSLELEGFNGVANAIKAVFPEIFEKESDDQNIMDG